MNLTLFRTRAASVGVLMFAVLLGGCAGLTQKTAQQSGLMALQQYNAATGYNFKLQTAFDSLTMPDFSAPRYQREDFETEAWFEAWQTAERKRVALRADGINRFARGFRFTAEGAVDTSALKFEINPQISFNQHNLNAGISVPLLLDGQNLSALVDISALGFLYPAEREYPDGRFVHAVLPAEQAKKLDVKAMLAALNETGSRFVQELPADAWQYQPLTEQDKRRGVASRIRLHITEAQSRKLMQEVVRNLVSVMSKGEKASEVAEADLYEDTDDEAAKLPETVRKELQTQQQWRTLSQGDLLIDSAGRLLAYEFKTQSSFEDISAKTSGEIVFSNWNHPVFTLHPAAADIVEMDQLKSFSLESFLGMDSAKPEGLIQHPEMDQADNVALPEPAPKAKTTAVKARPRKHKRH